MHVHAHKTSKVPESLRRRGCRLEVVLNWCTWGFQHKTKDAPGQTPWKALMVPVAVPCGKTQDGGKRGCWQILISSI